jgi:hypothetical protein
MILEKFKEIANAWIAAANPTPEQKEKAEHRITICNTCEHRRKNVAGFFYCGLCGCPLKKKVFAENKSSCPKNKWVI